MQHLPNYHFAPAWGWMNDPNGLIFHDGIYEVYFQHNPYGVEWGNMTWGHARTKDLCTFEELQPVLFPDENGTMFSGCAILNHKGLLGLPKDAILYFYTAASERHESKDPKDWFTIRLAYSLDRGNTLTKTGDALFTPIAPENRDPKVFYHEATAAYLMVLYLEKNDYAILRSTDLKSFEITQRLTLPNTIECPDLFPLSDEEGKTHWVFWTAGGVYYIGDFDGYRFQSDLQPHFSTRSPLPYAAQSFAGLQKVLILPWLRTKCVDLKTTGVTGYPRELSLVKDPHTRTPSSPYLLRQRLPEELKKRIPLLRIEEPSFSIQLMDQDSIEGSLVFNEKTGSLAVTYRGATKFFPMGPGKTEGFLLSYDQGIIELSDLAETMVIVADIPQLRGKEIRLERS